MLCWRTATVPCTSMHMLVLSPKALYCLASTLRNCPHTHLLMYCSNSESFDRKKLHEVLHASFTQGAIKVYPDVSRLLVFRSQEEGREGSSV